jgi:hypothetical protein
MESMDKALIGILGATSRVGKWLWAMLGERYVIVAFSRKVVPTQIQATRYQPARWFQLPPSSQVKPAGDIPPIKDWICLAPIWAMPRYFTLLSELGAQRLIALSSTSRFSKQDSSNPKERRLAADLQLAEEATVQWAVKNVIQLTILRSTMIYGSANDGNISLIMRFIMHFGFFPLFGTGQGLRQPVHGADVAKACLSALDTSRPGVRCLNISGADVLSYREMIERIFKALGKAPRFINVPIGVFRGFAAMLSLCPRFGHFTASMAERMNQNLNFDHSEAKKELGFSPRGFNPVKMI